MLKMAKYKQKCAKCKTNYVLVASWRDRSPTCYECQKNELQKEIDDPELKKLFDIPEEYYIHSPFLRNIKISYIRYKKLSDRQIEAFNKALADTIKELGESKEEDL